MIPTRSLVAIVLCAVFTCDAYAMSVQFSAGQDVAFSEAERRTIRTIAESSEREVRHILPQLTKELTIEVRKGVEVIDSTGESAAVAGPQKIVWIVDARRREGVAAIAQAHLRFALFHEMHHLVRGASIQPTRAATLIDRAITEGLATAFARDFADIPVSWWGEYPSNIDEWAREFLALPDSVLADQRAAVGQWMFRHPDGRRFIGYKVGTYLVDTATKASGHSSVALVSASTEQILEHAKLPARKAASAVSTQQTISLKARHDGSPSFEEVAPPPEEANAIKLSGKTENPNPETWLRMQRTNAAPWWIGPTGPLVVRNVSQATLTPFLPDPAKATGAAMIVAPGGGTLVLAMDVQGYQIAKWLNERGIAAFVLKYRLVPTANDLGAFLKVMETRNQKYSEMVSPAQGAAEEIATHEDAREAVRYVRARAAQWKLSQDRIGFIGFSAGGYTAVGLALKSDSPSRPDLVALIYGAMPGVTSVPASAPPVFIAATSDDPLYSLGGGVDAYLNTYAAWQRANVPAELHMFASGGHGFGIAPQEKSSDAWLDLLNGWLREHGFAANEGGSRH